jgi:hypothetical protein
LIDVQRNMKTDHMETTYRHARLALLIASWLYALAFHFAYVNYVIVDWAYWGFTYRQPDPLEFLFVAFLVTFGAVIMPTMLARASSIILLLIYQMVYIPTVMVTLSLDTDRIERYGPALVSLAAAFAMACIASRRQLKVDFTVARIPGLALHLFFWLICSLTLSISYWSIIHFANLDETYQQRVLGASTGPLIGYMQTYLENVFSPGLIAIGLVRRRLWLVILGVIGCLLIYAITAQRTAFLLPVAIFGTFWLLRRKNPIFRSTAVPMVVVAGMMFLSASFYEQSGIAALICLYLTGRTVAVPGLTFSQYYDFFSQNNFTWWSHVKGFSSLVAAPVNLSGDPLWPQLGLLIGEHLYKNPAVNVNANLYSSGLAAAGIFGVIAIGFVAAVWLRLLDRASAGLDSTFVILAVLPVGLTLTNAPFATVMLSFGGLFWLILFSASGAPKLGSGPIRPASTIPSKMELRR